MLSPLSRVIKKLLKPLVLGLLAVGPTAIMLRRPVWLAKRLAEKMVEKLDLVYRNLPRVHELAKTQGLLKAQIAAKYYLGLRELVDELPYKPKISVIVPVYKVDLGYFREALQSVAQQVYDRWELCLVDDCSGDPRIGEVIAEFAARYPGKIKSGVNQRNSHISATSNACLKLATGDYVTLLDHDDRIYPNALAETVRYINLHGQPDILYSDECTVDGNGNRIKPIFFKPGWSPLMHLTMNYTTHLTTYKRSLVDQVGGFRVGYEGSQDHDLMLRMVEATNKPVVHIPMCLYQWRAHVNSTANSSNAKPYAAIAGEKAVTEHLQRRGRSATVVFDQKKLIYRVTFALPSPAPLVSVVIPSRDAPDLIRRCLTSVLERSTYQNFEIVIADNGTTNAETLAFYREMETRLKDRFRLLLEPRPFNFGAQVNAGARAARGDYLLLLNNDTEVKEPAWIEEMLGLAQFPEVGAVGAKLLFGDDFIQHAGVTLNTPRIAEHLGLRFEDNHPLYWNTLNTIHETMAVTAACMMVRKDKFWEVGGLDQVYLPRGYGDVEFCLALRDKGYVSVYTPFAALYHHESASRGKNIEYFERNFLLTRRGQALAADPYMNPNFERTALYEVDKFFLDLDLDRREFDVFLQNPMAQWRKKADEFKPR